MSQPDLLFLAFVQLIPPLPELRFVATVTTGGRVKFVPAVQIFPENNAISRIICVELQNLHTPSVILHWKCQKFTHSVKF